MISDIALFTILISSSVKYLFTSFAHFLIELPVFLSCSYESSLYVLDASPVLGM